MPAVIVDAVRTPIGRFQGGLSAVRPLQERLKSARSEPKFLARCHQPF